MAESNNVTAEYAVMRENYNSIVEAFEEGTLLTIVNIFFSRKIFSEGIQSMCMDPRKPLQHKASKSLTVILKKMQTNPTVYSEFIDALNTVPCLTKLANELETKKREKQREMESQREKLFTSSEQVVSSAPTTPLRRRYNSQSGGIPLAALENQLRGYNPSNSSLNLLPYSSNPSIAGGSPMPPRKFSISSSRSPTPMMASSTRVLAPNPEGQLSSSLGAASCVLHEETGAVMYTSDSTSADTQDVPSGDQPVNPTSAEILKNKLRVLERLLQEEKQEPQQGRRKAKSMDFDVYKKSMVKDILHQVKLEVKSKAKECGCEEMFDVDMVVQVTEKTDCTESVFSERVQFQEEFEELKLKYEQLEQMFQMKLKSGPCQACTASPAPMAYNKLPGIASSSHMGYNGLDGATTLPTTVSATSNSHALHDRFSTLPATTSTNVASNTQMCLGNSNTLPTNTRVHLPQMAMGHNELAGSTSTLPTTAANPAFPSHAVAGPTEGSVSLQNTTLPHVVHHHHVHRHKTTACCKCSCAIL